MASFPVEVLSAKRPPTFGDGIFGTGILRNYDVEFDMQAMVIRLRTGGPVGVSPSASAIPCHRIGAILRVSAEIGHDMYVGLLDSADQSVQLSYALARSLIKRSGQTGTESPRDPRLSIGDTVHQATAISSSLKVDIQLESTSGKYPISVYPITGCSGIDVTNKPFSINESFSLGTLFFFMHRTVEIDYPHDMLYVTPLGQ